MINSEPAGSGDAVNTARDAEMNAILGAGAKGAVVLVGLATAIVVATWFAFYLLVFVPRAIAP